MKIPEQNFEEALVKKEESKQLVEGIIGKNRDDLEKVLPPGIKPDEVDKFIGSDGFWHWHLIPELIEDEKEREKWEMERKKWPPRLGR